MKADTAEIAEALLAARKEARHAPLPSELDPQFDLDAAYAVADAIRSRRIAAGERPLGYKIGFTNRTIWDRYGVYAPIWAPIWDTTVELLEGCEASLRLDRLLEPRLEPEIMVGFARAPSVGMSEPQIAACVAWVAHGFEIVDTQFAGWRFRPADTVADFALHARLLVGPRVPIDRFDDPVRELASVTIELLRDGRRVDSGTSDVVLGGPLTALRLWIESMAARPERWPIEAGDIVSTGTLTDAAPIAAGERWETRTQSALLRGLVLTTRP